MLRTQKVKLYPNQTMKKVLDELCDYRRYCWNQGLATWNEMYDASVILADKKQRPNERKVRDELVANKANYQLGVYSWRFLILVRLGRIFSIKLNRTGGSHGLSRKRHPVRGLRLIEPS